MLFYGIVSNICIMITGLYLIAKLNPAPFSPELAYFKKIQLGIVSGLLGYFLMLSATPSPLEQRVIFDFRHIPVIYIICYVGPLPAVIACMVMALLRLTFGIDEVSIMLCITYLSLAALLFFSYRYVSGSVKVKAIKFNIIILFWVFLVYLFIIGPEFITQNYIAIIEHLLVMLVTSTVATLIAFAFMNDIRKQKRDFISYRRQAEIDFLTNLKNRRAFSSEMKVLLKFSYNISLLVIDVDKFKSINDTYGHEAGDKVLKQLADIIKNHCSDNQLAFRVGGEEFAIIQAEMSIEQSHQAAEMLRLKVAEHPFLLSDGNRLSVSISIGMSSAPKDGSTTYELYRKADTALYKAKYRGRNQVVIYDPSWNSDI